MLIPRLKLYVKNTVHLHRLHISTLIVLFHAQSVLRIITGILSTPLMKLLKSLKKFTVKNIVTDMLNILEYLI